MSRELLPKSGSPPTEHLRREMHRALDSIGRELARLEILAAAMAAFTRPVPDYEFGFQHQRRQTAHVTELRNKPSL